MDEWSHQAENERIRGAVMVGEISEESAGMSVEMECIEKRRRIMLRGQESDDEGGRQKRRWLDSIRNDLTKRELSGEEDRVIIGRHLIRNIDPTKLERMRRKNQCAAYNSFVKH